MDLAPISDESVIRYYEAIRTQVAADIRSGGHRFIGQTAKDRAHALLAEIRRRHLNITPIEWRD
jgi:hypothetical protein